MAQGSAQGSNISVPTNLPIDVIMPAFGQASASFSGLQTITAIFPPSWDFWELRFLLSNLTLAMIQEMRILLNNSVRVRVRGGALWQLLNSFDNVPEYQGSGSILSAPLTWYFRRLGIRGGAQALGAPIAPSVLPVLYSGSAKDMSLFSTLNCGSMDINGSGIGTLSVEFDLVNTGSNTPKIACTAVAGAPTPGGAGLVRQLELSTPNVTASSMYNFGNANLKFGDTKHLLLNRLHFYPTSGTLDNFVVRHNGIQKLQRSSLENDYVINQEFIRTSQSSDGLWTLDWSERTWGDEMLPIGAPGTDLQVDATPSATGTCQVYQDSLGTL